MKEMVYSRNRSMEVLYSGIYEGHKFAIISLGTHPTAYVECKLGNCSSYNDNRLDNVKVPFGFTFLGCPYWSSESDLFLGWDYAHFCDFAGYEMSFPERLRTNGKKWTTAEIFEEVKSVIEQLKEVESKSDILSD